MSIGWPQGIWLALIALALLDAAVNDGKPRPPKSFDATFAGALLVGVLLYWGGFFS